MYFIFTKNSIPQFMLQYVMVDIYCRKQFKYTKAKIEQRTLNVYCFPNWLMQYISYNINVGPYANSIVRKVYVHEQEQSN